MIRAIPTTAGPMRRRIGGLTIWLGLAGCVVACSPTAPDTLRMPGAAPLAAAVLRAPPPADPARCWHAQSLPGIYETVTEQVMILPERRDAAGVVVQPAAYRSETRQREVRARQDIWFEVPCAAAEPAFVATLQRALKARGVYLGPVTGATDPETQAATRRFQALAGLDSDVLSLVAARMLGIVAEDFDRPGG